MDGQHFDSSRLQQIHRAPKLKPEKLSKTRVGSMKAAARKQTKDEGGLKRR